MKDKHKENYGQLQKVIKSKEDEFNFSLFLIKASYKTIIDILRVFCGGFFNISDPNLNHCYVQCLRQVKMVLQTENKIHQEIGDPPVLFASLVGDIEEADTEWELGYRQAANDYYGRIENLFIKYGSRRFEMPKFIQDFFDFTKKAIDYHKKTEATWRAILDMTPAKKNIIKYGNITIDADKSTLQYKNNSPIAISLNTNEIVLLALLIRANGNLVKYEEIIEKIRCGSPDELPYRKCHYLKRNLGKFLLAAGMSKREIAKTIVSVRGTGYRLASK